MDEKQTLLIIEILIDINNSIERLNNNLKRLYLNMQSFPNSFILDSEERLQINKPFESPLFNEDGSPDPVIRNIN